MISRGTLSFQNQGISRARKKRYNADTRDNAEDASGGFSQKSSEICNILTPPSSAALGETNGMKAEQMACQAR